MKISVCGIACEKCPRITNSVCLNEKNLGTITKIWIGYRCHGNIPDEMTETFIYYVTDYHPIGLL